MAYISLLALFLTVTNLVPLSAVGFDTDRSVLYVAFVVGAIRLLLRRSPRPTVTAIVVSTLLYDPQSFAEFDFYRRDGNFLFPTLAHFAGCLYVHRLDLNKVLRVLIFAVGINIHAVRGATSIETWTYSSIFTESGQQLRQLLHRARAAGGFFGHAVLPRCWVLSAKARSKLLLALTRS